MPPSPAGNLRITRREAIGALTVGAASLATTLAASDGVERRIATFTADVTPRLGHPLLGSHYGPTRSVDDPLSVKGLVLLGFGQPIVLSAIDWCEVRNDAYALWREALASAAGTTAQRVLFAAVHQHDAPLADLGAQRILAEHGGGVMLDQDFHQRCVDRATAALRESLSLAQPVTDIGLGQAKVDRVASSRRVELQGGSVSFRRMSRTDPGELRNAPEGPIDPYLKTISFWDGERPLAAISAYATHPMSHYGQGAVSADFPGLARERRQADSPAVTQVYFSGCSGDVTAGKYNDGSPQARQDLTDRLHAGFVEAWNNTKRQPLREITCRSAPVTLPHSDTRQKSAEALRKIVADSQQSLYPRAMAAMGLSSLERNPSGHRFDVQAVDFGPAQIVLLPGETLNAYQRLAQQMRPDQFIMAVGYGESAPGYVPTDAEFVDYVRDNGWCWVSPGCEASLRAGLAAALNVER